MEAYYVTADLKTAESIADGVALEKIRNSLALREGQEIDASTRRPSISYELLEGNADSGSAEYLYRLTIEPPGFSRISKKSRLRLRATPRRSAIRRLVALRARRR